MHVHARSAHTLNRRTPVFARSLPLCSENVYTGLRALRNRVIGFGSINRAHTCAVAPATKRRRVLQNVPNYKLRTAKKSTERDRIAATLACAGSSGRSTVVVAAAATEEYNFNPFFCDFR